MDKPPLILSAFFKKKNLIEEKDKLGFFKFKDKKALALKIEEKESKLDEMLPIAENTTHILIELRQNTYLNVPEVTEPSGDIIVVDSSSFFVGYEYLWELTDTKNELYIYNCLPEIDNLGAFANANNLTYISIPPSVKKIGRYSFRDTQLTSVRLARDCEYFPTSFPDNCEIFFYD